MGSLPHCPLSRQVAMQPHIIGEEFGTAPQVYYGIDRGDGSLEKNWHYHSLALAEVDRSLYTTVSSTGGTQ